MRLILKSLKIENFKGIKKKEIDFFDKTEIIGENESGKTTIYDAYYWLLFDKDSDGKATFDIKPIDTKTGEERHKLVTTVEGSFELDDQELVLRKEFQEKWTKKRGSATESFTGHTTDYYWQGVPSKKKDYEDNIGRIIDESLFKLLSNPQYFNQALKDDERRKMIMQLVDEPANDDVIATDSRFEELEEDLRKYTIEDLTAIEKHKAKKINEDKKEIPARIDELYSAIEEKDFKALKSEKKNIEKALKALTTSAKTSSEAMTQITKLTQAIAKLESEAREIRRKAEEEKEQLIAERRKEASRIEDELKAKEKQIDELWESIEKSKRLKEEQDIEIQRGRDKWKEVKDLAWTGSSTCPTCHQDLPKDQLQESIDRFNKDKEEKIKDIVSRGKLLSAGISALEDSIKKAEDIRKNLMDEIKPITTKLEEAKHEIVLAMETDPDYGSKLPVLEGSVKSYEEKLKNLGQEENEEEKAKTKEQADQLEREIEALDKEIAQEVMNEKNKKRIQELEEEETKLSQQYEETQYKVNLCEEFNRAKMDLVSQEINGQFQLIKWKLFEEQINGGIRDVCIATYKGVPYASVNSGGKILIGLDIINTLSKEKDIQVPVWIDNAESVTDYKGLKLESQEIRLKAIEGKKLGIKEA